MSALLDLHPDTDHPVLAGVAEIDAVLDRMLVGATTALASGEHATALTALDRVARRLEAVRVKVLAAADKVGAAKDAGFTGTEAWTARLTNTSRATAAREVHLATELQSGHDTTAAALDQGLLSPAHASVILNAGAQLPATVSAEQRAAVEAALVQQAQRFDPDQLRRVARRALEAIEHDPVAVDVHENELVRAEEETARDRCSLSFHDNQDGTTSGHFTVPRLAAAVLKKVLESMTAPRRMRTTGDRVRSGQAPSPDWRHRRGLALAELLEHLPTDHLHPKTAATVVVTVDHTALTGALKVAHLDTGETISAGEARRLACNAGLIPAILASSSVALDLGRETRLFTEPQRLAAGLRHDTCLAEGCERPYAWAELHHRDPWAQGGRTDLANAEPLCHFHHQRIHDGAFHHHRLPDGSIRFRRRT